MTREELHVLTEKQQPNICQITAYKNGEKVYSDCWNGYTDDDCTHIMSATKSIIALLVGIAVDKGLIKSIDDKVLDYFPNYKIKRGEKTIQQVTIRHLLTMRAPYKCKGDPWTKVCTSDNWTYASLDFLGGRKGLTDEFNYQTVCLHILSGILYAVTGMKTVDYANEYPTGSPILLYAGNYTEQAGEAYGTDLGSHPEYGDSIREVNARQFVDAWNGTVIPPQTSASGKDYVYFESASDAQAPGGSAAHGVCPSARALRSAVTSEGFDLPVGMCWDEDAVLFGYNPAQDITVFNNYSYPVKINMWTEGEGTGMGIYSQIVRYVPE
jgi:hypothetical protein